jgi:chromosome partitioning protein
MNIPVLTFLNFGRDAGTSSLTYQLLWMFVERGLRVLAVDLDPQANLTTSFVDEETLDRIWNGGEGIGTILDSVRPAFDTADFAPVAFRELDPRLALVPGHPGLAALEGPFSTAWTETTADPHRARSIRTLTSFWRSAQQAAGLFGADLIVFDVGAYPGALNRSALSASDFVVLPAGSDLVSLQALRSLGPLLRDWRDGWSAHRSRWHAPEFELPVGAMTPLGYVAMRHRVQLTRPVQASTRWLDQVPAEYRRSIRGESDGGTTAPAMADDPHCLAMLKNYHSLMPLSQEAGKPIFALRPADGAIGAHAYAVREAYNDFNALAREIAMRINPAWAERLP